MNPRMPTSDASCLRLLVDIGGTNARFALQAGPDAPIMAVHVLATIEYATVVDAMTAYLCRVERDVPVSCAIAIASPVMGDRVAMTNHHWTFSIAALKARMGFDRLLVVNDFTALALALPTLPAAELRQVGGGAAVPGRPIGLVGPGTGLGISGLLPSRGRDGTVAWAALQGEGGHATLAGRNAREYAVLAELERRYAHASGERVLSGQGLVDLYRVLAAIDAQGTPEPQLGAPEITQRALDGDAICTEALDLFCAFLGTVAGNLALTLGAQGGIYIGGGIVSRFVDWLAQSPFRSRFDDKGRFTAYLASIPVFVIDARQSPALLGAGRALDAGTNIHETDFIYPPDRLYIGCQVS